MLPTETIEISDVNRYCVHQAIHQAVHWQYIKENILQCTMECIKQYAEQYIKALSVLCHVPSSLTANLQTTQHNALESQGLSGNCNVTVREFCGGLSTDAKQHLLGCFLSGSIYVFLICWLDKGMPVWWVICSVCTKNRERWTNQIGMPCVVSLSATCLLRSVIGYPVQALLGCL